MTSPSPLITWGRLGWASRGVHPDPPWVKLVGRLWWKRRVKVLPPAPPQVRVLHWAPGLGHYPLCGASIREAWTLEYLAATCPECRAQGWPLLLQKEINDR